MRLQERNTNKIGDKAEEEEMLILIKETITNKILYKKMRNNHSIKVLRQRKNNTKIYFHKQNNRKNKIKII